MKRSTLAILTAATLTLATTACGTDNEPTKTKTVTQTASPKAETADVPEDELTDAGRTGRDVIDAIRDEAAYLERAATRIDQNLRSFS